MRRTRVGRRRWRSLYLWHRYLGLAAAIMVLMLSVTGLMLNHTEALRLDERHVASSALLNWYGIRVPENAMQGYPAGEYWVSRVGERLYLDSRELDGRGERLIGAIPLTMGIAIAVDDQLLLVTPTGETIERLRDADGVPAGLSAIGRAREEALIVRAAHGFYRTDPELITWQALAAVPSDAQWSMAQPLPEAIRAARDAGFLAHSLRLEQFILDLHSGRLFGRLGVYAVDAAAILFLVLSATGLRLWWQRRKPH